MIRIMDVRGITPGEPDYNPAKREEWLLARRGYGCGSDTATLFGMSVNTSGDIIRTPFDVVLEKRGLVAARELDDNGPAYHGGRLESYVADEFSKKTGIGIIEDHWFVADDEYPRIAGNVDYYTDDNGVLECTTSRAQMEDQWPDGIYFARKHIQVQQYIHISGRAHGYLACLFGGQKLAIAHVERDDDAWAMIVEAWEEIWPHIDNGTFPELWPETPTRSVAMAYPIGDGEDTVTLPSEATAWIEQYERAKRQIARLGKIEKTVERKRKEAEAQLIRLLDGERIGVVDTPDGYRRVEQKDVERKAYPVAATTYRTLKVERPKPKR